MLGLRRVLGVLGRSRELEWESLGSGSWGIWCAVSGMVTRGEGNRDGGSASSRGLCLPSSGVNSLAREWLRASARDAWRSQVVPALPHAQRAEELGTQGSSQ